MPVAKTVHAVAGQQRPAPGAGAMGMAVMVVVRVVVAGVGVVVVLMPVVPELGLVEEEEKHHAHQQGGKQLLGPGLRLEGLWQQVHEGGGQQRAGRQAQQMLRTDAGAGRVVPGHGAAQKAGRQPDAANAGGQGGDHNCYQIHSGLRKPGAGWRHIFLINSNKKGRMRGPGRWRGLAAGGGPQATPLALNHSSARFQPSSAGPWRKLGR